MPLDGGQVVESLVWKATGDRNKGAVVAGWCGRVLTVLLVLWFFVRPLAQGAGVGFARSGCCVIGSVLWTGATESIRRGRALSQLVARSAWARCMQPADRAARTPRRSRLAIDLPTVVVTPDERGVPCLVLAATDRPRARPVGAPASRRSPGCPDENVVEARPTTT